MKVAFISDLHGNMPALEAVLNDIESRGIKKIICNGDIINPLKESLDVYQLLKDRNIPILRGNHEDYIYDYFYGVNRPRWEAINVRPISLVAEHLGKEVAKEFHELPFSMIIEGPDGNDIYACHASPISNMRSYYDGIDEVMGKSLDSISVSAFVSGHRHLQWSREYNNKLLVSFGSLGLPLNHDISAEYLIMNHDCGKWTPEFATVKYDNQETIRRYVESGFFHQGGPFAWLIYDEILTGERRVGEFFKNYFVAENFKSDDDWVAAIHRYFKDIGRFEILSNV